MPRLHRPHISKEIKCRVLLRQLGEFFIDEKIEAHRSRLDPLLNESLCMLAVLLGCDVRDLRLDHNPALALRKRKGEGRDTIYIPAANDPEFLIYRDYHSHHIKTNVRGDGAQYPDRVLIKRARRSERPKKKKYRWPRRKLQNANRLWHR